LLGCQFLQGFIGHDLCNAQGKFERENAVSGAIQIRFLEFESAALPDDFGIQSANGWRRIFRIQAPGKTVKANSIVKGKAQTIPQGNNLFYLGCFTTIRLGTNFSAPSKRAACWSSVIWK